MILPDMLLGKLLRRYKRFLADVRFSDGQEVTVHCPNTGAMTGCAEPGSAVWCSTSDNPKRKYAHTLEFVQTSAGYVSVNTGRANRLVGEALSAGKIPTLQALEWVKPEVKIPHSSGRFDYAAAVAGQTVFIEVKSATMLLSSGQGAFPDAVSARALKHVQALRECVAQGHRALLIFCAQHCGITSVRVADEIDPAYADGLRVALHDGVEVMAFACSTDLSTMEVGERIPFHLP